MTARLSFPGEQWKNYALDPSRLCDHLRGKKLKKSMRLFMRGASQGVVAEKNAPSPPHPLLSYKFYVHLKKYCKYVSLPYHFFATNRVTTKPIFTKQVFKTDFSFTGASETSSCLALLISSIKLPLPPSASLPIICNINIYDI